MFTSPGCIAFFAVATIQVATGQVEESTKDQFQTLSLASEVFDNGLKIAVRRKWPLPPTEVARDAISRSCFCICVGDGRRSVGGTDDDGSSVLKLNQDVELTMTTGRVMDSQSQSVTITQEGHRVAYVWNCRIFPDIASETFEISVVPGESGNAGQGDCCLNFTFRSRKEFQHNSQPRFIFETSAVNSVQFKTLDKFKDEFGIHVLKGVASCDVIGEPLEGVENSLLHVIHPHESDNVNEINPYRKLTIPVYFYHPDREKVVVSFGVAPVGKGLRRALDDFKLSEQAIVEIKKTLAEPFFLEGDEDGSSADSSFIFVFRPSKGGSYSQEFEICMDDGSSLDFCIKGKCYDPSKRRVP